MPNFIDEHPFYKIVNPLVTLVHLTPVAFQSISCLWNIPHKCILLDPKFHHLRLKPTLNSLSSIKCFSRSSRL